MAKDVDLALSGLLGAAGEISFQLANLAIVAGADALEGAMISMRGLPKYEKNLAIMEFQYRRIPMDIEIAQRNFRECQKKMEARNSMRKPTSSSPPSSSEATASKSSGSGMGTALPVGIRLAGATAAA